LAARCIRAPVAGTSISIIPTRDEIFEAGIHKEREEFIDSIKDHIRILASSYHNGDECEFFKDFQRGRAQETSHHKSNNVPDGDRWVFRVSLAPYLAMEPWEKVENEVAVIQ
jgi:hypothetical protein